MHSLYIIKKEMSMGESGNQGEMKVLGHNDRQ